MDWITTIIQLFIYPGLMFIIVMVILTQWYWRKASARMAFRRGPSRTGPIGTLQPFADFFKLLMKEDVIPRISSRHIPVIAASLGLGALIASVLLTPIAIKPIYAPYDSIVLFYFLVWSSLAIALAVLGTPNPYTNIGVGRYLALIVSAEPILISALLVPIIVASKYFNAQYSFYLTSLYSINLWTINTPSSIAMILALIAGFIGLMGVLMIKPFDFPEAETEIYWGIFTEYGGPRLALLFFIHFTEKIILPIIYVLLFLGGSAPISFTENYWLAVLVVFAKYFIVYTILCLIDTMMPRYRPDQAIRFLWKYGASLAVLALIASILA